LVQAEAQVVAQDLLALVQMVLEYTVDKGGLVAAVVAEAAH
jgi:hypothetical protein